MDNLKKFITQIKSDKPDNITKIYFSRKTNNSNSKHITHNPLMSKDVQSELFDTIFPYVDKQLESIELVEYNPLGVMDGELEHIKTSDIPELNCTPFVRQHDILFSKWGDFYAKRSTKQTIYPGI